MNREPARGQTLRRTESAIRARVCCSNRRGDAVSPVDGAPQRAPNRNTERRRRRPRDPPRMACSCVCNENTLQEADTGIGGRRDWRMCTIASAGSGITRPAHAAFVELRTDLVRPDTAAVSTTAPAVRDGSSARFVACVWRADRHSGSTRQLPGGGPDAAGWRPRCGRCSTSTRAPVGRRAHLRRWCVSWSGR
jgi:hypothetical protein